MLFESREYNSITEGEQGGNLLGLILILNIYIKAVIDLSQRQNRLVGLLPRLVSLLIVIHGIRFHQVFSQNSCSLEGVVFGCLIILSILGFLLYIISRFGDNKRN